MANPLDALVLTHDMHCARVHLYRMGCCENPRDQELAAIAYTVQLAIESGSDPTTMRELETKLMNLVRSQRNMVEAFQDLTQRKFPPLSVDMATGPTWEALRDKKP